MSASSTLPPISAFQEEKEVRNFLDQKLVLELQKIPNKMRFTIGEVAHLLQIKPYVLRYWETEFLNLKPQKSPTGRRMYFKKDVELALLIRTLLYQEGFSIKGAKKTLKNLKNQLRGYHKDQSFKEQVEKDLSLLIQRIQKLKTSLR